jgi:hypothetical protein
MMKKIINNVNATIAARKVERIISGYQKYLEELMAQRESWRIIAVSPTADAYSKELARKQIVLISNAITDLVCKRTKVLESSL